MNRTISMKRGKNYVGTVSDTGAGRVGRLNSAGRSWVCDCERDFSGAGDVIQEQRSKLKPSKVDDVLFLHSNLKHHSKHQIV